MLFSLNKKRLGRLEYVDIPELNLSHVTAKIDTGAYRGAIHVSDVKEIEEDGVKKLQFQIKDNFHPELNNSIHKVKDFKIHRFRGTQSDLHERYVITVKIKIAGELIDAELSLADRSNMRYPILIGRRLLKGRFLVDIDKKY